jgi:hypothetical protein
MVNKSLLGEIHVHGNDEDISALGEMQNKTMKGDGCLTDTLFGKLLLKTIVGNMRFEKDL